MGRNRFILILSSVTILFAIFILFAPRKIIAGIGLDKVPLVQNLRNRFNVDSDIEIILLGDVMLGRTVMTTSLDKNDPTYPFLKVKDRLSSADLTVANLESPLTFNCPRKTEGLIFCADEKMAEGLTFAGIDLVNIANNHTLNYGKAGFEETTTILHSNGVKWTGNGELTEIEVEGVKFGFLGFDKAQQGNPALSMDEEQLVRESNTKVDVLIVSIHWGVEYQNTALPGVQALGKKLVELGADVVHGTHPHWVQNIDYVSTTQGRNRVPIYYSLGNFVFDQMWSEETREGLAVKLTFDSNGKFIKDKKMPIYMKNLAQPQWKY